MLSSICSPSVRSCVSAKPSHQLFQSEIFLSSCNLCCDQHIKTQMSSGGRAGKPKEEEQDGMSVHSPCKPPPSSASSLPKEQSQVELEMRLLEALEIYPPMRLQGNTHACSHTCTCTHNSLRIMDDFDITILGITKKRCFVLIEVRPRHTALSSLFTLRFRVHRHFVLYGLMEFLKRKFDRHFSSEEVLQLLDRFYNIEMLKTDDDEIDLLTQEEEFSLPQSYFVKEEP
ncbi:hypothetical protein ACSQ67_004855 [Phaseolus vulgaris]